MNLLEQIRAQIRATLDRRSGFQTTLDEITAGVTERGETCLNEDETTRFAEARDAIQTIDTDELPPLQEREAELAASEEARQAAEALATRIGGPAPARTEVSVRVGNEPDTYREGGGHSFVVDLFRAQVTPGVDRAGAERLARHQEQAEVEGRATLSGSFAGLIPPVYLLDEFAPIMRAGRPFSNAIRQLPLPADGLSFVIPRGTTGTKTDSQTAEGTTVEEQDYAATDLTFGLRTIAGSQSVSRQALERGQNIDRIIFADLAEDYAVRLNAKNIAATLAQAQVNTVSYTSASPKVGELYLKLADAIQQINTTRFVPATVIFMHPRRWGWLTGQTDSEGRPLITAKEASNPVGLGTAAEYGQVVGELPGLGVPVITDASIPTNLGTGTDEDVVIVARASDLLLWEEDNGMPRELTFEQPQGKKLLVDLIAYGYSAFTAGRYPKGIAKITGTGLVTPTF